MGLTIEVQTVAGDVGKIQVLLCEDCCVAQTVRALLKTLFTNQGTHWWSYIDLAAEMKTGEVHQHRSGSQGFDWANYKSRTSSWSCVQRSGFGRLQDSRANISGKFYGRHMNEALHVMRVS
jgi:hypothetical protein